MLRHNKSPEQPKKREWGPAPPQPPLKSTESGWQHDPATVLSNRAVREVVDIGPMPKIRPVPTPKGDELERIKTSRYPYGWKLHLNFDPYNPDIVKAVDDFLAGLKQDGHIKSFKIGQGGGKEAEAPGKEATVYIGPLDQTAQVAEIVSSGLQGVLLPAEGDALTDDVPISRDGLVWGRFATRTDRNFINYGNGVPLLEVDFDNALYWRKKWPETALTDAQMLSRSTEYAIAAYGDFFNGTSVTFDQLMAHKQQYLTETVAQST